MWPDGVQSFFAYCLALLAGSFAIGNLFEPSMHNLRLLFLSSANLQTRWSQLNEGLRELWITLQPRARKSKQRLRPAIWLVAPFLLVLAGCSVFKPKLPEPTPVSKLPQPVFSCIDKAIRLCPGVAPIEPTDCAMTVKIASSALTALEQCQTIHAELILCVLDYIQQKHK